MIEESKPKKSVFDLKLEQDLLEDKTGTVRDDMIKVLGDQRASLKGKLQGGLPPDQFEVVKQLDRAIEIATEVVTKVWDSHHKKAA